MLNYVKAETLAINNKINRVSNYGKPQEDFLYANITAFLNSDERKNMLIAWDYYMNEGDIKEKTRKIINRQGVLEESNVLTNSRLFHPFMKKLTKQKQDYLLKKKPTYKHEDEKVVELLEHHFNKKFHKKLKVSGRDSIIKGKSWIQVYYTEAGVLSFKRIPTEQLLPFWADEDHTILDAIVRIYSMTLHKTDGTIEELEKVEYHTPEGVWYYQKTKDGLVADPDKGDIAMPGGHFSVEVKQFDEEGKPVLDEQGAQVVAEVEALWNKVPFVCFKYNAEEASLLTWIKSLVDDYDKNTSDNSDTLQDTPNNVKVVKNYDGADVEAFNHNLNTYRTAFVGEDGDMKNLDTVINSEASEKHLDRLRKDTYTFGNGVDTQETELGNASGVSMKFRTLDLQTDCEDMGSEFESGLIELAYFINIDATNKGMAEFDPEEIEVVFNSDTIINEQELITMAKNSVGVISDDTIISKHPWVEDALAEQKALDEERVKRESEEIEYAKKTEAVFGTNTPNGSGD